MPLDGGINKFRLAARFLSARPSYGLAVPYEQESGLTPAALSRKEPDCTLGEGLRNVMSRSERVDLRDFLA